MLARFLLWRLLGVLASFVTFSLISWLLDGGIGSLLRGTRVVGAPQVADRGLLRTGLHTLVSALFGGFSSTLAHRLWALVPFGGISLLVLSIAGGVTLITLRWHHRSRRCYVRLGVDAYRTDRASAEAVIAMFDALHKRLLRRWWRRLVCGQPSVALEVHHSDPAERSHSDPGERSECRGWLAVTCPAGLEAMVESALRAAYPNCRVTPLPLVLGSPPVVLRLKKHAEFIKRVKLIDHFEHEREPAMNRLMTVMGACGSPAFVQLALTPTPAWFEHHAKRVYKHHEARLSRERRDGLRATRDRSMVEDIELRGGLDVQHAPLFFADLRVVAADRGVCERIASELRAEAAENRLVERGTAVRHGLFGLYRRRVQRGEGNPLPGVQRGVFASTELAAIWHLPSSDYATVPFTRAALPLAPASPAIFRPTAGPGALRDALGAVSIHPALRRQNTAVPGTVEQGKSSYLTATVAEDLRRQQCAVIVFDPKGDAAEATVSLVPEDRVCTLLDFSHPTCGFSPLAVDAPADVIADYVVGALKNLFTDTDIKASSDRYLRNAIIAVLAYDRRSTLWDAARLLSVGEDGYAYRARVGAHVRALPEFKEISEFFTAELSAQLADSRSMTTAKLDAPVNKLARLLNSPSIKRVLLNDSLSVDFERVITQREVLVVKGALGAMGAGNTSVLMQLLIGMLDAALARQQDMLAESERVAVALKVDEAPLVLNRGFAETMALKRSAGLETVACWQTDAQWVDREVRDQLDALFAHRVYFATASARDARAAVDLLMAEYSDMVRSGISGLSALAHPDVRLHLPKHHAIVSWSTPEGRQPPFIARTIPMCPDPQRLAFHAARQAQRGGRFLADLRQPHWDRKHALTSAGERLTEPTPREQSAPVGDELSAGRRAVMAPVAMDAPVPTAGTEIAARERASGMVAAVAANGVNATHAPTPTPMPALAADGYRELVELDGAHTVRWAKPIAVPRQLDPEQLDLEILVLVASLRHVLSSQIHRRFNRDRAATTTQRRLKRLSDAGLLERFQFHRRDGGGVPMCYVITAAGLELLYARERLVRPAGVSSEASRLPGRLTRTFASNGGAVDERALRHARHDVHVAGWVLAFEQALAAAPLRLAGAADTSLSPTPRAAAGRRAALGPADLMLPGGRVAHGFRRTDPAGQVDDVQRFETVRPDAAIGFGRRPADTRRSGALADELLVELDDRRPSARMAAKLERYDHLVSGWWSHAVRAGPRLVAPPQVVFVSSSRARARECARAADCVLTACHAYAGEYPAEWEYPGRERIVFAAERDVHEGLLCAYRVSRLPPDVRVVAADGDPRAREPLTHLCELNVRVSHGGSER
ncbi:MAG TPA: replication-relaxation family protein [Solirubrobacteraceae bacterium]|nr:replication-relaxation family protein [Solirubrobacteraceae bacterium]